MGLNITSLLDIARKVEASVSPLLGTVEAGRVVGLGAGGDQTKYVDAVAEETVFKALSEIGVACTAVSEESGVKTFGAGGPPYVVIDSIDGTYNASRGLPFYAVSLALSNGPNLTDIEAGVVRDLKHGVAYWAGRGWGAYLDNKPMKTSSVADLGDALIGVDLSSLKDEATIERLKGVLLKGRHIRHLGSDALELCYIASGHLDAFIDIRGKLRITDIAAGYLIVKEAGGLLKTLQGESLDAPITDPGERVSFVASANASLLRILLALLK